MTIFYFFIRCNRLKMSSSEESFELGSNLSDSYHMDNKDLLSTIPQLSDELEYFGLPPLPQVTSDESGILMKTQVASLLSALIDAMWNLLQVHQSTVRQQDETEDIKHRLADDNKNLRTQIDHLKKELLNKEKQLSIANENEQRLNSNYDKLQNDLKTEKEEVRRLLSQISQRDSHHAHELRKKENEVLQVQEQLRHNLGLSRSVTYQVHSHKQHETNRKSAPEICYSESDTNLKQKVGSKMYQEQVDVYKKVICKFESNNQALIHENTNLRDIFYKLHVNLGLLVQRFADFMEKNLNADNNGHDAKCKTELKILPPSIFQMPYDDIREYNKELNVEADKYIEVLEMVLKKLELSVEEQTA